MILTESGGIVERILYVDEKLNIARVALVPPKRKKTVVRDYFLNQLRADGGRAEILAMAERRRSQ